MLATWVILGGWNFTTKDIRRPLVVDLEEFPKTATEVQPLIDNGGSRGEESVKKSLRITRKAVDLFGVCKYEERFNFLMLSNLAEAIEIFPGNAFAWHQLGAYLALMNQAQPAIQATEASLDLLRELPVEEGRRFAHLRTVGLLNLASLQLSEGDNGSALQALEELGAAENLEPFHRLAYYWTSARVLSALGSPEAARTALQMARDIPELSEESLSSEIRMGYPQYFDSELRGRNFLYIEGLISLDEGDTEKAVEALSASLRTKPRLFENSFALANALFELGKPKEAIAELTWLEDNLAERPHMFFKRERVAFNLGNIYLAEQQTELAIKAYERAIRLVKDRAQDLRKRAGFYLGSSHPGNAALEFLNASIAAQTEIFSEAYNNLGNAYFQRSGETQQPELLGKAELSYRKALENELYDSPYVARANLGRLYWHKREFDRSLTEMALALASKPNHYEALGDLFKRAGEVAGTDGELAAKAYSVLLDALDRLGPREYVLIRFGSRLDEMLGNLTRGDGGPESQRALGRLYFLKGDTVSASAVYEASRVKFPQASWPLVGLARIALEKPDPDLQEVERLLASVPSHSVEAEEEAWAIADRRDIYYLRGKVKLSTGDFAGAQSDFNKALAISPGWEQAEIGLAYVKDRVGAPSKA